MFGLLLDLKTVMVPSQPLVALWIVLFVLHWFTCCSSNKIKCSVLFWILKVMFVKDRIGYDTYSKKLFTLFGQIWKYSDKPENEYLFLEITLILSHWSYKKKGEHFSEALFFNKLCIWKYYVLKIRSDSSHLPHPNWFAFLRLCVAYRFLYNDLMNVKVQVVKLIDSK